MMKSLTFSVRSVIKSTCDFARNREKDLRGTGMRGVSDLPARVARDHPPAAIRSAKNA